MLIQFLLTEIDGHENPPLSTNPLTTMAEANTQKIRVDVYSLPSNKKTKLRCFVDIEESKAGELIAYLMTRGKSVTKGGVPKLKS